MNAIGDSQSDRPSKRRRLLALATAAAATALSDRVFGISQATAQPKPESGTSQRFSARGLYVQACNCEVACPCIFLSTPSAGYCTGMQGWHIDTGNFEEISLDGLNVVLADYIPGHILKGNWKVRLYVDQRANAAQRAALDAIFTGKAGGQLAGLRALISEELPPKAAQIDFVADGNRRRMVLSGLGEIDVTALQGAGGAEVIVHDAPFSPVSKYPLTIAKSTRQSLHDQGINLDLSEKNGFLSRFWYAA
jgi:hypothetical protein